MAEVIIMPRLSDTMTEGTVAQWLKNVGDKIAEGDILAEIETDKATMEFESFHSGTLLYIGVQQGQTAPVDTILAIIGEPNEDYQALLGNNDATNNQAKDTNNDNNEETSNQELKSDNKESSTQNVGDQLPDGVQIITMPRLSDTMTEGTVATWLKKVGDKISEGDMLAEIETDKATMEFESFYSGTLLHIGIQEGASASVDSVLAIIGPEGSNVDAIVSGKVAVNPPKNVEKPSENNSTENSESNNTSSQSSNQNQSTERVFASPLAKKLAEDKGIKLSDIKGSGENGRIVKADVENFAPSQNAQTTIAKQDSPVATPVSVSQGSEEIANSQMRKTIARRLAESKFTAPHYYLTIEIDMDNAMQSREMINALPETKVSFNDMVVKAVAMALKKHPKVNSQWTDQATILHHDIHIGVAVAVEDGLVVPVINNTNSLTLTQIGAQVKTMAEKARNKKLQPKEMEGSTFTVSNLGMFGIEAFTSIINQPNSAILSVGAIIEKPVVKSGQIVVGNTMKVTLACDHRTVDGATGAQFLQTFKQYLENPVTMLA